MERYKILLYSERSGNAAGLASDVCEQVKNTESNGLTCTVVIHLFISTLNQVNQNKFDHK